MMQGGQGLTYVAFGYSPFTDPLATSYEEGLQQQYASWLVRPTAPRSPRACLVPAPAMQLTARARPC
jgi:hypothetical protein